jgi:hypothetical protein
VNRRRCVWCGRPLEFRDAWVHADTGETYERYVGADGRLRDDHVATPNLSPGGAVEDEDRGTTR